MKAWKKWTIGIFVLLMVVGAVAGDGETDRESPEPSSARIVAASSSGASGPAVRTAAAQKADAASAATAAEEAAAEDAAEKAAAAEERAAARRAEKRAERRAERRAEKRAAERRAEKRAAATRDCEIVPDVVGLRDLQLSQDTLQAAGFYLMKQEDATGAERSQLWDRNWVVVRQSPEGGTCAPISTFITTWSKKHGE